MCDQLPGLEGKLKIRRYERPPAGQGRDARWLIERLLQFDHVEPRGIANATVYRIRSFGSTDHTAAAEELDESEFLVDVCRTAIDHETGFALEVYAIGTRIVTSSVQSVHFVEEPERVRVQ